MNKREIVKLVREKATGVYSGMTLRKIKVYTGVAFLALCVIFGGVYAMGADNRAAEKAEVERKKQEIQLQADKSAAYLAQERVKQEMIDNSERAKDAIIAKGEYSPITSTTEREPEISSKHKNAISEWWSKNTLRVHIPYEVKYIIDMEKLSPLVTETGLYVEFGPDDFNVVVIPGTYSVMTPEDDETGLFPYDFDSEETLALVSANAKIVAEEYANDSEKLSLAVEETKIMLESIAESFGSKINFVEKRSTSGAKIIISDENKGGK